MAYSKDNVHTEFNASILRLVSFNKLIDDCNEYSRLCYVGGYDLEHLKLWRNTLLSIYREICPKMDKEEKIYIKGLFSDGNKIGKVTYIKKTPDGNVKVIDPNHFKSHWNLFNKIDAELRILADKKGMLMINKEDYGDIIGEGDF